jgi:2-methylisocitrate lyase-like PEP mutase family enzyme
MLYVRAIRERQDPTFTTTPSLDYRLVMSRIDGTHGRTLYQLRSGAGTLWTTALSSHNAYVTVLKGRGAKIVRVSR